MIQFFYKCLLLIFLGFTHPKETLLSEVEQLTFAHQGFESAGEAYFSPDSKKIIFQAVPKGENGYQIFIMDLLSKEITQVSLGFKACTCAYFHPSGQRVIFAGSPERGNVKKGKKYQWDLTPFMNIYEANLDGSDLVQLTFGPAYHAECAYSPDGLSIVYASNEGGGVNIYRMQRDGSKVKRLTHTKHCYNGGPFFSPDGTKIIFRADRELADRLQIYSMDSDGSNVVQLTDNEAINWAPFWYPKYGLIAYTTSLHGHHNYEIYLLSTKTQKSYRVTHHPSFDGLATFNQEGTKMLWTSKRGEENTSQIFIANFTLPACLEPGS